MRLERHKTPKTNHFVYETNPSPWSTPAIAISFIIVALISSHVFFNGGEPSISISPKSVGLWFSRADKPTPVTAAPAVNPATVAVSVPSATRPTPILASLSEHHTLQPQKSRTRPTIGFGWYWEVVAVRSSNFFALGADFEKVKRRCIPGQTMPEICYLPQDQRERMLVLAPDVKDLPLIFKRW